MQTEKLYYVNPNLQQFTAQTIFAATLYWFVFILTVWGLCTILFGLKNKVFSIFFIK